MLCIRFFMCMPHKLFCNFCYLCRFILILGSISTAYMTLGFIGIKYLCRFGMQSRVDASEPTGNILMYGRFADSKGCCGASDRTFLIYKVFRKPSGTLISVVKQNAHLVTPLFSLTLYAAATTLMTAFIFAQPRAHFLCISLIFHIPTQK